MSPPDPAGNVPALRIRQPNNASPNPQGEFVLYWMIAFRRGERNFSLQRAVDWARSMGKPLVILEALRCDYPWASARLHRFLIEGMAANAERFRRKSVLYYPYLEPQRGVGRGLLAALAKRACVVVSDDFPCFFLPQMIAAAARQIPVCFELVDSNGILPMRAANKVFARAYDFRRFLQNHLRPHLLEFPKADPLARVRLPEAEQLPAGIRRRWPPADLESLATDPASLAQLPIDHAVDAVAISGGSRAARTALRDFLKSKLPRYHESRNQPEADVTSGLSPYLHFGHVSAHQVFVEVMQRDGWSPGKIAEQASGRSHGWWGASPRVESFLDQLITWRELGYNMCSQREDFDRYDSLPDWAKKTLADHARDAREHVYSLQTFAAAETHDPLWNAAQRQLVREGRIHNYLRMLWGKKILEWSATPREALETMIELNDKYALDGRDPNSYSGIFWILGRYDRAWGPERPIFGKVRYMSSENTARKFRVGGYLERFGPAAGDQASPGDAGS